MINLKKKMIKNNFIIFFFFCCIINFILIKIFLILSSYKSELKFFNNIKSNLPLAVYSITSKKFGQYNNLLYRPNIEEKIYFSSRIKGSMKNIRFIPIKKEESTYYIEFVMNRKIFGLNETSNNAITLYDNISCVERNIDIIKWRIFKIDNNSNYLIQNLFSKKFWKTKGFIYLECSGELIDNNSKLLNYSLIDNSFIFKIVKLYEEVEIKKKYIDIIEKEPVDILIKYIDLNDPFLKRDGIKQIKKDIDNGELKYSLRSILRFIPWVRKIFILMPNEKVRFLKPVSEISDKIVYIKDKDLLGFDSESSTAFQYNLFKLKKFGISDNFILMDDDYFVGRELKKTDFFYFEENSQSVVPLITSMNFNFFEVQIKELASLILYTLKIDYNDFVMAHTPTGWKATKSRSLLFLMKELGKPLINGGFDHNAIPVNLNDIEEIYNLIYLRYKYSFLTLNSISRTKYDLQYQLLYTTYILNKKHRKVKTIYSKYYDVKNAKNATLGAGLFCINTGFNEYNITDFETLKSKLEELFPIPTIYEISPKETDVINNKTIADKKNMSEDL